MASIPSKRSAPTDRDEMLAEARRRAEEAKARIQALRKGSNGSPAMPASPLPPQNGVAPPPPSAAKPALSGLDAIKARIAAAQAKQQSVAKDDTSATQAPQRQPAREAPAQTLPPNGHNFDEMAQKERERTGRGGVNIALHPLLRADAPVKVGKDNRRGRQQSEDTNEVKNPYIGEGPLGPARKKRELNFTHDMNHRPALQAANEMRRKAALDEMKAKIQASAAKAGLDEAADVTCFQVPEPPDVEWWDEQLQTELGRNENITNLIVHPVLIDPAQEKFTTHKGPTMYLTKKEQKKMRRIRRAEQHKEEQTKIRLGLAPAPEPKINHKNVMRVYGELAVQGPSAVEEMVNKQMAERQNNHLQANAERQLTKEEKLEKQVVKARENAAMGLSLQVYKISLGSDKLLEKHRFLINKNAQQWNDMNGFALVTPSFTLVLVEGGAKSTVQYKKLMLRRIKWQAILEGGGEILDKEKWEGVEDTTCELIHEGQIRERRFKKWGGVRDVDTDQKAKDALTKAKLENFWVMAKSLEKAVVH